LKSKYLLIVLFLIFSIFLTGCSGSGIVTPDSNDVGGDFYICENLLKGYYTALSNRNYTQALTYCKSGGIMFEFANNMWDLDLDYPTLYFTYQIYNFQNFSYLSYYVKCDYDMTTTQRDIYGVVYNTNDYYDRLMLFEKVNGEWKLH